MLSLTTKARPKLNRRDSPALDTPVADLDYGHIPVGLRIADEANIVVTLDDTTTGTTFTSTVRSAAGITADSDLIPVLFIDAGQLGFIEWSTTQGTGCTVGDEMDRYAAHIAAAIVMRGQDVGTPIAATVLSHNGDTLRQLDHADG